ncbi:MAG: hypothetical protein JO072_04955 [Parafilimonas sp.]|nr:hypothetical protein [Parafilimonas sp.]
MKKIFLAASLLIAATSFAGITSANATTMSVTKKGDGQHISQSQVPPPVLASFNANFPNAVNVQWEKETEHGSTTYQATFLMNGKRWRATFSSNGTLLSSGPKR